MKELIKIIIRGWNFTTLRFFSALGRTARGNRFYLVGVESHAKNFFSLSDTYFEKTKVRVCGSGNTLITKSALISKSEISIHGNNNKIVIEEGVLLRRARILMRGSDCSIEIGKRTSFGGIRIVNVGRGCAVTIGEDCMFADEIELWASDTHPIYDAQLEVINQERAVHIGNRVWVGGRVIILKGVIIGSGSVIGMGTVVTRNIPDQSISVGHPNTVVKSNITWSTHYPDDVGGKNDKH